MLGELADHGVEVDGLIFSGCIEDLSPDHGHQHVAAAGGVAEVGHDVMAGHQVGAREIEEDQVRVQTGLDHPAFGLAALCAGAADRSHHQGRLGREGVRVRVQALCQQGGGLDLLKEVEVVVRRGPVGAEGDVHARLDHRDDVGAAGGQLEIRDRAVDRRDLVPGQEGHILRLEPDAVGGLSACIKNAVAVEELGRGQAVPLLAVLMLLLRLGQVDMHAEALVDRKLAERVPEAVVGGVFGVDRDLGADAAVVIAVPAVAQGDQLPAGGIGLEVEVLRKEGDAAGEIGLDAGFRHGLGNRVAVVVHIRDRGRAEAEALGDREQGRGLDGAVVQLRLAREDIVVEPGLQIVTVGIAAQQAHRQVGMAVDQTGHEDHALAVDDLFGTFLGRGLGDEGDLPVRDAHEGSEVDVHRLVHRDGGDVGE